MSLTKEQLLKCYDIVFEGLHSESFKVDEMKDMLTDKDYHFLMKPRDYFQENLESYLSEIDYNEEIPVLTKL